MFAIQEITKDGKQLYYIVFKFLHELYERNDIKEESCIGYNVSSKLLMESKEFFQFLKDNFNGYDDEDINNIYFLNKNDAEKALQWSESVIILNELNKSENSNIVMFLEKNHRVYEIHCIREEIKL